MPLQFELAIGDFRFTHSLFFGNSYFNSLDFFIAEFVENNVMFQIISDITAVRIIM
jgi:hypothetical protein